VTLDIKSYLSRFHALPFEKASLENISELQSLHLQYVPFENFDVIRKIPIYLNLERIYEKIVDNNRGGYCYELNGLFHWLLSKLEYDVHLVAATVLRTDGKWAKADTHAAMIVYLDEPYLVDVGFGAATPRIPIPLSGRKLNDSISTYWINTLENGLYDLVMHNKYGERIIYRFSSDQKELIDFHEGCVFNQVSKESSFTSIEIATRNTPNGQITLTDRTLKLTEDGVSQKKEVTEEEKNNFLKSLFELVL